MPLRALPRPARCRALCALLLVCGFCLTAPLAGADAGDYQAFVPDALLQAATANPGASFKVIIQGSASTTSNAVATNVRDESSANPGKAKGLARKFAAINGVSAELTGKQILKLAKKKAILAITEDAPVALTDASDAPVSVSPPAITGTAQEGQALTAATGDWSGLAPLASSYRWQRCGNGGSSAAVLADAPLDYWPFGETGGTSAVDQGAGGHNGTYLGGVASGVAGAGGSGTGAGFDGSTGYVDVPGISDASFATGFTLEAWVKSASAQTDRGIVGKWTYPWGGLLLWIDGSGNYSLAVTANMANYLTTSVAPTTGTWEHVVGTWDGTMLRLYVNGTEVGSRLFTGVPGVSTDDLQIGNYPGPDKFLNGAVDEIAVYDHALTGTQIRAHELGCANIDGASDPTYVPTSNDVGSTVRVVVTASNAAGTSSAASEPTTSVLAAPPAFVVPANTAPPTIAGSARDGETLTATEGTWTGTPPLTYAYQWQLCDSGGLACSDVAAATSATYALHSSEVGKTVRVVVTAGGAASGAASEPSAVVAPAPPSSSASPAVDAPTEGTAATAAPGAWNGTAPIAYSYSWQRCDGECTTIDGATGSTYTPVAADVGHTLRVVVHASNAAGEASATSAPSTNVAVGSGYSSAQLWPYASGVAGFWPKASSGEVQPPAIAIVDSGIDASRADFGDRVVQQVTLTTSAQNSPGDGEGHGTFVASVAAGQAHDHTGAAPNANIVSLDVMDDHGMATVSDVIAATDWIYQNKDAYNIRVANFSLTGSVASSVKYDPLDKAVEKLWLSGVVVVAAAGNYAESGNESGVGYAPANDPFVITVGAQDLAGTLGTADDLVAPWSAFGYTPDGFAKPDLSAPGRYIVGAVPPDSTLARERPQQVVEPGYMQLSGTSFAAPIVSGTVAELLGAHPAWTPDQVKGALMLSADPLPLAVPRSSGVGAENASRLSEVTDPPNPNLGLVPYVVPDPSGSPVPVFDAAAWGQAAETDPAWSAAAWGQAAWGQAAWGQAAWGQAYWSSAAWGQGANSKTNPIVVTAEGDVLGAGGYWITSQQLVTAQAALGLG